MSDGCEVFIHVGLHRTATTFLQTKFFPKLKNINFQHILYISTAKAVYGKNLFSGELLSVNPFSNKLQKHLKPEHRFSNADSIKKMFPKAKIIIATRDKEDWKFSIFSTFKKAGGSGDYVQFCSDNKMDTWTDFESYVDYLCKIFSSVFHYRYEDFKNDNHKIVGEICDFIGVDIPEFENVIINPNIYSEDKKKEIMRSAKNELS